MQKAVKELLQAERPRGANTHTGLLRNVMASLTNGSRQDRNGQALPVRRAQCLADGRFGRQLYIPLMIEIGRLPLLRLVPSLYLEPLS